MTPDPRPLLTRLVLFFALLMALVMFILFRFVQGTAATAKQDAYKLRIRP